MSASLKEIQRIQLEMLLECRRICEKYNIEYYLAQGTLLGAVRHKGMIPWDDDIDILVRADHLERFKEAYRKEGSRDYFLECFETEPYCPQPWAKLRKNNTTSMAMVYKDMPIHWGICIDLFPYYPVKDGALSHKLAMLCFQIAKKALRVSMVPYEKEASVVSRLAAALPAKLRCGMAKCAMNWLAAYHGESEDVLAFCKGGHFLKRSWLEGAKTELLFEGERFRVPTDYDAFLTHMFGDYMTPPPPEEQKGHELRMGDIVWDTERDYSYYQN